MHDYCIVCAYLQSLILLSWAVLLSTVESYPFNIYPTLLLGIPGGKYFDDYTNHDLRSPSVVGIDKIYIRHIPATVLAIQVLYRESNGTCRLGFYHGEGTDGAGKNGEDSIISLSKDEYLSRLTGWYEETIRHLSFEVKNFHTGRTRSYNFGSYSGQHFTISGPIYAFHGYSGARLDKLGVYLSKPTNAYGYSVGTGFWDPVLTHYPPISRLYKVCIRHGLYVDSIQFTYLTNFGTFYITSDYGGSGGEESCFTLAPNERITIVQIHRNNDSKLSRICALKFTISVSNSYTQTNNQDASVEGKQQYGESDVMPYANGFIGFFTHVRSVRQATSDMQQYTIGPFGEQDGEGDIIHHRRGVLGFFGFYSSKRLTALGIIGH